MVKNMRSAEIGIANEETLEKDEGPILKKSLYAWKKITVSLLEREELIDNILAE